MLQKLSTFVKKHENILAAFLLAAFPIVFCIIRTAIDGRLLSDVWAPGSGWNDEPFYYKQIEGMIRFGAPRGFWGFNESRAEVSSFAAWGPVIIIPYYLFGLIFGWNLATPYIFHILILAAALFCFAKATDAGYLGVLKAYVVLLTFFPLARYILSYMSEILIISAIVFLLALYKSEIKAHGTWKTVLSFAVLAWMIIVRPYFVILASIPYLALYKNGKKTRFIAIPVAVGSLAIYAVMSKLFAAPYIGEIYTNWLSKVFTHGPGTVLKEIWELFVYRITDLYFRMYNSVVNVSEEGAFFLAYILLTIVLLVNFIICLVKRKKTEENRQNARLFGTMIVAQTILFFAILIMYNFFAGFRHLLAFMVADALILLYGRKESYINGAIVAALFAFIFIVKGYVLGVDPIAYKGEQSLKSGEIVSLEAESVKLSPGITWDNTVIIVSGDISMANENGFAGLGVLYKMPAGFGVSFCESGYVENNIGNIKSGYLLAFPDSVTDKTAVSAGYRLVATCSGYNIYRVVH